MGCCVSTSAASTSFTQGNSSSRAITATQPHSHVALPRQSSSSQSHQPQRLGRTSQPLSAHINHPLKPHLWTSNQQLWNRTELDREREEFFDTRVTGRPEIWQAIHIALEVLWRGGELHDTDGGYGTAQTILTAADITIPTGDLANGVYDSFGAFYPLPEHIVSDPVNLAVVPPRGANDADKSEDEQSEEEIKRRDEKGKGVMVEVKARLSDNGGHDLTIKIGKDETVRLVTRRILEASGHAPPKHIKLAYRGKLLAPQRTLSEQGWQEGHVINAMVFE